LALQAGEVSYFWPGRELRQDFFTLKRKISTYGKSIFPAGIVGFELWRMKGLLDSARGVMKRRGGDGAFVWPHQCRIIG
jgi:hypothetical protein